MTRKVADVFVVMKGEVPDRIFKNKNATAELQHSTPTITSNMKKEAVQNYPPQNTSHLWRAGLTRWLNRGQGSHLYS